MNSILKKEYKKEYNKKYYQIPKNKEHKRELGRKYDKTPKRIKYFKERSATLEYKKYMKGYLLQKEYGISLEGYNKRIEQQQGICPICNRLLDMGKNTHVDHNHNTGKIRGILCSDCNHAIGLLRDSIPAFKNAIKYLEKDNN